jgi:predicted porin
VDSAITVSGGLAQSKTKFGPGGRSRRLGFGLAAKHNVYKRTFLHTGLQYAKEKIANTPGSKVETLAVGVQHEF